MPIRAVADTNLFVSLARGGGATLRRFVELWDQEKFVLITSPPVLEELYGVLRRMRSSGQIPHQPHELVEILERRCERSPGAELVRGVCRDPDDDKFLSCAVEGQADYLVTGDGDLLALGEYQGIRIVTPRQFVQVLDALENEPTV